VVSLKLAAGFERLGGQNGTGETKSRCYDDRRWKIEAESQAHSSKENRANSELRDPDSQNFGSDDVA